MQLTSAASAEMKRLIVVCFDIDKAQTKLKGIRRRLQGVQEEAAAKVQLLTAADTKLTAAIVAALLSTRRGNADA